MDLSSDTKTVEERRMQTTEKRKKKVWVYLIVAIVGIVLGRLGVRFLMNLLLGGTMFGGDFL